MLFKADDRLLSQVAEKWPGCLPIPVTVQDEGWTASTVVAFMVGDMGRGAGKDFCSVVGMICKRWGDMDESSRDHPLRVIGFGLRQALIHYIDQYPTTGKSVFFFPVIAGIARIEETVSFGERTSARLIFPANREENLALPISFRDTGSDPSKWVEGTSVVAVLRDNNTGFSVLQQMATLYGLSSPKMLPIRRRGGLHLV